ncbi:MAG: FAD-dependent oxidoreductase [Thermohalobaculum sp.]|nr:FAD-dependent oxidoreductase [Thermohalobaculum sp.]
MSRLRLAVVGGGIAGLGAAWLLSRRHDVVLFEAEPRLGGHARTIMAPGPDGGVPVDTGFIVFNHVNYPHLVGLFEHLAVPTRRSDMSFAVSVDEGAIEYGCKTINAALAQRVNALRPAFWRMVRDIMVFNRTALAVAQRDPRMTIGGLIEAQRLGEWFTRYYLLPMSGAIWSTPREEMRNFPALAMARFFENHGLLSLNGQHQWWTVDGGSREYVGRMAASMQAQVRLGAPVRAVTRDDHGVLVKTDGAEPERFDQVILAGHSDQTLAMLADADAAERRVLERVRYKPNLAVLHTDARQMPRRRACWSSWVYQASSTATESAASVTYWMNSLQGIPDTTPLFVTLNPARPIPEEMILDQHICHHPQFDLHAMAAQAELPTIQGRKRTWFCGAWTRHGFHEDGLGSAVAVARELGATPPWQC